MSLNEFENEVKEHLFVSGLVVKEISRNSLVELPKKVNMASLIGPNFFEKEVHKESVLFLLVVKVSRDSLVELPKEVSTILEEF
jgi:hypothetical protein